MSTNQQTFAAKAEQVRLHLASKQTAAASAGSRLFSPRPAAGGAGARTVSFLTPTRSVPSGGPHEELAEDSGEFSSFFSVSVGGRAPVIYLCFCYPRILGVVCAKVW